MECPSYTEVTNHSNFKDTMYAAVHWTKSIYKELLIHRFIVDIEIKFSNNCWLCSMLGYNPQVVWISHCVLNLLFPHILHVCPFTQNSFQESKPPSTCITANSRSHLFEELGHSSLGPSIDSFDSVLSDTSILNASKP